MQTRLRLQKSPLLIFVLVDRKHLTETVDIAVLFPAQNHKIAVVRCAVQRRIENLLVEDAELLVNELELVEVVVFENDVAVVVFVVRVGHVVLIQRLDPSRQRLRLGGFQTDLAAVAAIIVLPSRKHLAVAKLGG